MLALREHRTPWLFLQNVTTEVSQDILSCPRQETFRETLWVSTGHLSGKDSEAHFLVSVEPVSQHIKTSPPPFWLCFANKETEAREGHPWPWLHS